MNLNNLSKDTPASCNLQQKPNNIKRNVIIINRSNQDSENDSINLSLKFNRENSLPGTNLPSPPTERGLASQQLSMPIPNIYPLFNPNMNYYTEFWGLFLKNEVLLKQMKEMANQKEETKSRVAELETQCKELEQEIENQQKKSHKKKNRRTANEIEKNFVCPYKECNKTYGSDVSLNLHIKLKHNGGNKTEREKLARQIAWAQSHGEKVPQINLNLPPGLLENINPLKVATEEGKEKTKDSDSSRLKGKENFTNFQLGESWSFLESNLAQDQKDRRTDTEDSTSSRTQTNEKVKKRSDEGRVRGRMSTISA